MKRLFLKSLVLVGISLSVLCAANNDKYNSNNAKLDVVYIPQNDKKSCATTSCAMAISYFEKLKNKPLDKETVWEISGTDE